MLTKSSLTPEELAVLTPERQTELMQLLDVMHVGSGFVPPDSNGVCDCEQDTYRDQPENWAAVTAKLDDRYECPFCRGYVGRREDR